MNTKAFPRLPTSEESAHLLSDFRGRFLSSLGEIGQLIKDEKSALGGDTANDEEDEGDDKGEGEEEDEQEEEEERLFDKCNSDLRRNLEVDEKTFK